VEGKTRKLKHFRVFGRKYYIRREDDQVGKFNSRVDKFILIGYSRRSKAYKCYNLRLNKTVKIINVNIDEEYVLKIKEESKHSNEKEEEEEMKEEEVEE
jgi:hypothetical protein